MNTVKINGYQFIDSGDITSISFNYSVIDAQGNILKSNIRRSVQLVDTQVFDNTLNTASVLAAAREVTKFLVEYVEKNFM